MQAASPSYSPGGQAQKLFVVWPKGPVGPRPLIHGGSWRSGDPRSLLDEQQGTRQVGRPSRL